MRLSYSLPLALSLILPAASPVSAQGARLELEPCELPGLESEARCGTHEVLENRAAQTGRRIPLRVVVLPATGESPEPDPILFLAGGPGASSVESAAGLAAGLPQLLARRDFLLVDYRGTGGSGPLFCPYQEERQQGVAEALETFLPVELLDDCAQALGDTADLTRYTTPDIVDDLAGVIRALGYESVNLAGGSYGSRVALVFLRRHPDLARTATLFGAVPTDARMPVTFAADAQTALESWLRECTDDPACAAAFPDLAGDLAKILAELDAGPKLVRVVDPETREAVELRLSRNAFVQTLRYMLYSSGKALEIPAHLRAAARGDWGPMAQTAYTVAGLLMASLPDGLYLSVTCTEDVAEIGPNAAAIQTGFLGDFRLRRQVAACKEWPRGSLPAGYHEPVRSEVPTLILSGARDPVTPPAWGYRVQEFLPRSAHLVVPHGGHSWQALEGVECIDELVEELLVTGSVDGLDVDTCAAAIDRPPFPLEIPRADDEGERPDEP